MNSGLRFFVVQAASPGPAIYEEWIKDKASVAIFYMEPWTLDEFIAA